MGKVVLVSVDFSISTDKRLLDIRTIHEYLSERSYWAKGRSLETVQKSIEHSVCVGVYDTGEKLVGFGRVLTDYAVFAYIMDVFILEPYRGKGLGKRLIEYILHLPGLEKMKRWQLATTDAQGLYKRYGFVQITDPEKQMEKVDKTRS